MDKQAQDKRWKALTEDGRQARIVSYQELLKLQKEEADSYLITIEDLEKLYGKHNLQPQPLTYEDVAKSLFFEKKGFYITSDGRIDEMSFDQQYKVWLQTNNCTSRKQAEKLLAINRLLNVAKFLNGDWKPDWEKVTEAEGKWYLMIDLEGNVRTSAVLYTNNTFVHFRSEELAQQAIQILGENTVRLALSSDF